MRVLHLVCIVGLIAVSSAGVMPAFAQPNPGIANCEEIKDEATQTQKNFCEAHVGCRLVFGIQKGCTEAKGFLIRLQNIMKRDNVPEPAVANKGSLFDRFKSIIGIKPDVTSNQVFEASMTESQLLLQEKDPDWKERSAKVRDLVSKADSKSSLEWKATNGERGVYIGDVKDGKANGVGVVFWQDGEMSRGEYVANVRHGLADALHTDGLRRLGNEFNGKRNGDGMTLHPDGRFFKGAYFDGQASGLGAMHRPDGTLIFKGIYDKGQPSVGIAYDKDGIETEKIDRPEQARQVRLAQEKVDAEARAKAEQDRLAAEQRRRDEASAQERAYQASLNAMNAGQLFAKADELRASGRGDEARRMTRVLVSRFPEHPLALQAAGQIAGAFGGSSNPAGVRVNTGSNNSGRLATGSGVTVTASKYSSICIRNIEKIDSVMNKAGKRNFAATGDGFWTKAQRMYADILRPCADQDANAKRKLLQQEESIASDARFCRNPPAWACKEWGADGVDSDRQPTIPQNRAWFQTFSSEAQAALNNPNGYSADLDGGQSAAADPAAARCDARLAELRQQVERANMNPNVRNSPVLLMQAAMYAEKESVQIIRSMCPATSNYQKQANEFERSYKEIERTCNQLSSSACVPKLP
jgi:hypothetical protein